MLMVRLQPLANRQQLCSWALMQASWMLPNDFKMGTVRGSCISPAPLHEQWVRWLQLHRHMYWSANDRLVQQLASGSAPLMTDGDS